jgi:hypothetical protein
MMLGSICALSAAVFAVRHYLLGHSLTDKTGEPLSPIGAILWFLLVGGVGGSFAVIGFLTYRWKAS